jgi:hypothetical protein
MSEGKRGKPNVFLDNAESMRDAEQAVEELRQAIRCRNYHYYVLDHHHGEHVDDCTG